MFPSTLLKPDVKNSLHSVVPKTFAEPEESNLLHFTLPSIFPVPDILTLSKIPPLHFPTPSNLSELNSSFIMISFLYRILSLNLI